jgi:hypothetical protein
MTLAVSWIRDVKGCEELIVTSDSRLSGGRMLDSCAKILLLPGSYSFLCCVGETDITYPLALQVIVATSMYERSANGSLDLCELRGHVLKILNKALSEIRSPVKALRTPERFTEFLFGGYSWKRKRFLIWKVHFSVTKKEFHLRHATSCWHSRATFVFAGDGDLQIEAKKRLGQMLFQRGILKRGINSNLNVNFAFDWEPFEVLRENANKDDKPIGGPPQIAKIYQHRNARYIGVNWPRSDGGAVYIAGRPFLFMRGFNHEISGGLPVPAHPLLLFCGSVVLDLPEILYLPSKSRVENEVRDRDFDVDVLQILMGIVG